MNRCPSCGSETFSVDFDTSGIVFTCGDEVCATSWREKPKDVATPSLAPHSELAPLPVRAQVAPAQPKRIASSEPIKVIPVARQRLAFLNKEIKRLEALRKERDELMRLLAAAKNSGAKSNVRQLRTASQG